MNSSELSYYQISLSDFRGGDPLPCAWGRRPDGAVLRDDGVHLWLADLDQGEWRSDALPGMLSGDERERAARFRFERDRNRYIARRALLRQLVGDYVQKAPGDIGLKENAFGKPALASDAGSVLQFNLSTSGEWALYGFTRNRAIGIDIEKRRQDFNWEEIASRFFHPGETSDIGRLPEPSRVDAFFTYWTLKEAFVKAHGVGLQRPLVEFDFSAVVREGQIEFADADGSKWRCASLTPGAGLAAGLVVES